MIQKREQKKRWECLAEFATSDLKRNAILGFSTFRFSKIEGHFKENSAIWIKVTFSHPKKFKSENYKFKFAKNLKKNSIAKFYSNLERPHNT
jgi:hypothetical protein